MPANGHLTPADLARRARAALPELASSRIEQRNAFLTSLAAALRVNVAAIVNANQRDLQKAAPMPEAMLDRLRLTPARIEALASAIDHVVTLPDPLGQRFDARTLDNGLRLHRRRVPLGVIGVIYEARPNVTLDIAALAIKTGNGAVLRGGSEALATNRALVELIQQALRENSLPADAIGFIDSADRDHVLALLQVENDIDLMIPRGGAELHVYCRRHARMPVVTGGIGICHLYVDAAANLEKATTVIRNAKVQRPTVCNALDTVLVHADIAATFIPALLQYLAADQVDCRLDPGAMEVIAGINAFDQVSAATDGDFDREWLSLTLGIAVVADLDAAVDHIRRHASGHSDGILTDDARTAARFLDCVDSAAVYWNASTRFTDGGEFGLGAEVAVSTQRMHARGPMGLEQLTSYKWVVEGDYHVRP